MVRVSYRIKGQAEVSQRIMPAQSAGLVLMGRAFDYAEASGLYLPTSPQSSVTPGNANLWGIERYHHRST